MLYVKVRNKFFKVNVCFANLYTLRLPKIHLKSLYIITYISSDTPTFCELHYLRKYF